MEPCTKAIILQNTRNRITCDLEINQNIHLRKLMKYDPTNSKFVSFSCMSFIKICLVWNASTVFDKTCLNKMSIIWQNRRTMSQPDMDSWLSSISHPEYLLLVYLVQPFWARHLQNTHWLLNIIVRSSKQRWLSV